MKTRCAFIAGQVLLAIIAGCGRTEPPKSDGPVASDIAYEVVQVTDGGTIAGAITISGAIPKLPPRPLNKDPNVCGTGVRESHQLIIGKAGGLKNAIVIVQNVKRGKPLPSAEPQINQSKCEYSPHVQVVSINSDIAVVNNDPILHNIHFYQNDDSLFNIAQPLK